MASAVLMAVRAMAAAIAVVLMLVLAVMMGTRGQDTILQGAVQKRLHGGMAAAGSIEQYRIGGGFALYGKHCKGRAFAKVLKHLAILCGNCKFHM